MILGRAEGPSPVEQVNGERLMTVGGRGWRNGPVYGEWRLSSRAVDFGIFYFYCSFSFEHGGYISISFSINVNVNVT